MNSGTPAAPMTHAQWSRYAKLVMLARLSSLVLLALVVPHLATTMAQIAYDQQVRQTLSVSEFDVPSRVLIALDMVTARVILRWLGDHAVAVLMLGVASYLWFRRPNRLLPVRRRREKL